MKLKEWLGKASYWGSGCNLMPPHNGCPFQLKYHQGHGSLNTQNILCPVAGWDFQDGSKDLKNFLIDVGTVWEGQSRGILTPGPVFPYLLLESACLACTWTLCFFPRPPFTLPAPWKINIWAYSYLQFHCRPSNSLCLKIRANHEMLISYSLRYLVMEFFNGKIIFDWNIIALQYCVTCCCTTTRISYACMCAQSLMQLCPTLCDPMDCNPPGSSVHGIFQARIREWVARGSSQPRDWTQGSCVYAYIPSFLSFPPTHPTPSL